MVIYPSRCVRLLAVFPKLSISAFSSVLESQLTTCATATNPPSFELNVGYNRVLYIYNIHT